MAGSGEDRSTSIGTDGVKHVGWMKQIRGEWGRSGTGRSAASTSADARTEATGYGCGAQSAAARSCCCRGGRIVRRLPCLVHWAPWDRSRRPARCCLCLFLDLADGFFVTHARDTRTSTRNTNSGHLALLPNKAELHRYRYAVLHSSLSRSMSAYLLLGAFRHGKYSHDTSPPPSRNTFCRGVVVVKPPARAAHRAPRVKLLNQRAESTCREMTR